MPHSSIPERPPATPLVPTNTSHAPSLDNPHSEEEVNDIYRGEPPSPTHSVYPESTTSSSSSSSWSFFAGRLGAFATAVAGLEQAISRWRGNASTDSSSSSSRSSILTLSRSQLIRRRKRRGSLGNLHSEQSERDFSARISLIKAREQSRLVPRQFSLYLPPSLRPTLHSSSQPIDGVDSPHSQGVLWTSSLSAVLTRLDAVLKKTARIRKARERETSPKTSSDAQEVPLSHHHFMLPDSLKAPSRPASFTDLTALRKQKRGKEKNSVEIANGNSKSSDIHNPWFLDVASPTSEDMRAIGKLLHLHPLTLEDILQQDPREKLEFFPKLGYYFISFRAVESRKVREKFVHAPDSSDNELLGEANVYLVVFNEGVCSFHFTDMSEHTDRVRNRIISLEKSISMSSAWIAHGILDSIVDSFFPFSDQIEREVIAIEDLVYSEDMFVNTQVISESSSTAPPRDITSSQAMLDNEKNGLPLSEKNVLAFDRSLTIKTRFSVPRPPLPLIYKRIIRYIRLRWESSGVVTKSASSSTTTTLRRMARTRRLVTSLTRLLVTKSDVVAQVRKRLLTGLGSGAGRSEEVEVAIYMGDVQDHIFTLQHSLAHYERMLSQSHPAYLAQLRNHVALTKSGTDKALIYLTGTSMAVLCIQTVIGTFSLNVQLPRSDSSYHVFGIVLAFACLVLGAYLSLVRWWWVQAKVRKTTVLG